MKIFKYVSVMLMCAFTCILTSCVIIERTVEKGVDVAKQKGGEAARDAGEEKAEAAVPGSTDKEPLLDSDGNPMNDEDGNPQMVYKTTIMDDILSLVNGGAGWRSFLSYAFAILLIFLSRKLGVNSAEKRLGDIISLKGAALDVITSKINKMAANGKFGGVIAGLVGSIESASGRYTDVGKIIHASVKKSEHKRDGESSV